jgi:hypothetical protein
MGRLFRKLRTRSAGPPPAVVGLLALELIAATVFILLGASLGDVLKSAGPLVALTLALLNPTVQDLGRRQAKLSVVAEEASSETVIAAPTLTPWPIDADRVVANELAAAREPLSWPRGATNVLMQVIADPFTVKPTEADYVRARDAFEQHLSDFEASLRDWLKEYCAAATAHSLAFDLTLRVTNASNGAHAEAVTIVVDLPETLSVGGNRPDVPLPPECPSYEPPRPRSLQVDRLHGLALRQHLVPPTVPTFPSLVPSNPIPKSAWRNTNEQRRLEAAVGGIHSGRTVDVGEPLLLLADRAGQHEIHWTAYTKSARRASEGTITLVVPPDQPDRPPFGRLHGVVSYPDVPIVDHDGDVVHTVRVADPPLQPPAAEAVSDVLSVLRETGALREWNALGLDPAADGPDDSAVVRAARPVVHHADD